VTEETANPQTAGGNDPAASTGSGGGTARSDRVDRETVRITADVGQIFGVDEREYELTQEDVVTLPAENAAPLVERDVAERLDRTGN
jgi:DNA replication factor GINS